MKGLVLYHSRGGSTETYARWIAESAGFECRPLNRAGKIGDVDVLVVGGCVWAGQNKAFKWIKSRWNRINGKKVVCFSTSGALKEDPALQAGYEKALPAEIRSRISYFPLNGKMIFAEMRSFDRKLMQMAIKMTAKENPEEAKKMAEEYNRVNREDLKPLLERLRD